LAEVNTINARASFLRSPLQTPQTGEKNAMPKDETGTLDAHKLRELAAWYREFVQSRAFGKLGCALLSSWSATLIFWKGRVNPARPASPHRQPHLSVKIGDHRPAPAGVNQCLSLTGLKLVRQVERWALLAYRGVKSRAGHHR
jgi:hypothetical protein